MEKTKLDMWRFLAEGQVQCRSEVVIELITEIERLQAKSKCFANAGPDEPVFVLRAQDLLAPSTIRHWADLLDFEGTEADDKIGSARKLATEMEKWANNRSNGAKVPD